MAARPATHVGSPTRGSARSDLQGGRGAAAAAARFALLARLAAAIFGGYGFAWGLVAAATSLLVAAGLGFHDAEFLSSLLGVLAFLCALLWAIAARRLWPVWAVLAGGGAAMAGLGSLVQAALT